MTTIDLTTARALVERLRDAEAAIRYSRDMIESLLAERDSFETLWRSTMDVLETERAERDAAVLAEREACAVICDDAATESEPDDFALDALNHCAAAIRARGASDGQG